MKRITKIGLAVAAGLALAATALAAASGPLAEGMMKRHIAARIDGALEAARATPEQRQTIYAARDRAFAQLEGLRSEHHAQMERVAALFEADRIDPAAVKALRADHEAQAQKHSDVVIDAVVEAHRVLSPEQRRAVVAYARAEHDKHEGRWMQRHHGGGGFLKHLATARLDEALDAVKATSPQRAAIHAAVDHAVSELEESFQNRGAHLDAALALFEQDNVDKARIDALRAEHHAKMSRSCDAIEQAFRDVHDALTSEQRHAAVEWVREHAGSFHHKMMMGGHEAEHERAPANQ
jgi:Spy/CpxP family protein refolding chaperone